MDLVELYQKDIDIRGGGGFKLLMKIDTFLRFSNTIQKMELKNPNKTDIPLEGACFMYLASRIFFPFKYTDHI